MKVYEVVLKGFNGATDETDHLIKWVSSHDIESVKKMYPNHESVHETDLATDVSGIDFVIK